MPSLLRQKPHPADTCFFSVIGILAFLWVGFVLWDVMFCEDATQMIFIQAASGHPFGSFFFYSWFGPGRAVVSAQWLMLGASCLVYGYLAGIQSTDRGTSRWLLLMGSFFILLLVAHAGEPQGHLRDFLHDLLAASEKKQKSAITAFAWIFWTGLAAIPLFALIRFRKDIARWKRLHRYGWTGFLFTALAGLFSSAGSAFTSGGSSSLSESLGHFLWTSLEPLGNYNHQMLMAMIREDDQRNALIDILLVSTLLEQSLRLIGAAAFLAAGIALLADIRARGKEPENVAKPNQSPSRGA